MMVFWKNAARCNIPKREGHVRGMKHFRSKGRYHLPRRSGFELITAGNHQARQILAALGISDPRTAPGSIFNKNGRLVTN